MKEKQSSDTVKRIIPSITAGLSDAQVEQRVQCGLVNVTKNNNTKTIPSIIVSNSCSLFNLVNLILFIAVLFCGSYKNMLFIFIVTANLLIGIIQEIRAKLAVDKLSFLTTAKVRTVRNGKIVSILQENVVADDIVMYKIGNQIIADSIILDGEVEVNEAFLTGESVPVHKKVGDELLSGSFITSGSCTVHTVKVGADAYISSISSGTKKLSLAVSEIMRSLKYIIRIISIAIFPIGILLLFNQLNVENTEVHEAIVKVVAALIGMIPEGLMLLTSTVLAVGMIRLAKYGVLTRELYCIESLARTDILCLDKTGTLTEGNLEVSDTMLVNYSDKTEVTAALRTFVANINDENATYFALKNAFSDCDCDKNLVRAYPFSSSTKYSAVEMSDGRTIIVGAPEFILKDIPTDLSRQIDEQSNNFRVLLLAFTESKIEAADGRQVLPCDITPAALILLRDKIRESANPTLEYFKAQGVGVRVISGDGLSTVVEIARRSGVENFDNAVDVSTLKSDDEIREAALKYTVFARVCPDEKQLLIRAMKDAGHVVAMTGDGVNDCLALKEASCSIAMASGADAAISISQFVLTGCDFATLPKIVGEGRRCINNIQRSASLFLTKTTYSTLFAIAFLFLTLPYPFVPIHLSLISTVTIGVPSFILALQPNRSPISGSFFKNVIRRSLPGGLTVAINLFLVLFFSTKIGSSVELTSTICVISTGFIGLMVLLRMCRPFNLLRAGLFITMSALFVTAVIFFPSLFSLVPISLSLIQHTAPFLLTAIVIFVVLCAAFEWKSLRKKLFPGK